jgi:hypothetical protein
VPKGMNCFSQEYVAFISKSASVTFLAFVCKVYYSLFLLQALILWGSHLIYKKLKFSFMIILKHPGLVSSNDAVNSN